MGVLCTSLGFKGQQVSSDGLAITENDSPFYRVFQFADIAGPVMASYALNCVLAKLQLGFTIFFRG